MKWIKEIHYIITMNVFNQMVKESNETNHKY